MPPLYWFKNISLRTLQAFFPRLVEEGMEAGDAFAKSVLTPEEYELYREMDVRDRHHARLVARAVQERAPEASSALLRAALLHDVGKSAAPYRAWERIFVHLYAPPVPAAPPLTGLRGMWQRHRHHALYGAEMIRRAGGDERVAELVERHHQPGGDLEAALLRAVDETF